MTTPQDPAEPTPGSDPTADPTPSTGAPTADPTAPAAPSGPPAVEPSPWAKQGDQTPQQPYAPPQSPPPWQQPDQPTQSQPAQQYPVPPYQGEQYPTQQVPAQADPYAQPGQYGQYGQPGQYAQPGQAGAWQQPGQYGQAGAWQQPGGYPPGSQYPPTAQWQAQFPGEPPGLGKPRPVLPWILGGAAALVVAAVLILGFVAPGWFTEKDKFKADSVADGVRQILTEDGFTVDAVSCPSDQEVEDGNTFTCDATVDGESAEVPITVVGDDGDYEVGAPS